MKKRKKKKMKEKKEKRAEEPAQKAPARSGDAIKVSAKDSQSCADILREMKAQVDHRKAGLEVLSIRWTRKEEIVLVCFS